MSNLSYSVAFSFGKKKELDFGMPEIIKSSKVVPGPGNYKEIDLKHVASKTTTYSFPKESRMPEKKSNIPGPGAYSDVKVDLIKKTAPKFSLSKTQKPKELFINLKEGSEFYGESTYALRNSFPSPGQYEIDAGLSKIKPRTKSVVLLKSPKDINYNNKIPGPGSYENNSLQVRSKDPKWSLPKTARENPFLTEKYKKELEKKPGPGNYNLNNSIGTGRKVILRGKPKDEPINNIPGPGSYNLNGTIGVLPSYAKVSSGQFKL